MGREINRLPSNVLSKKLLPGRHADGGNLYLSISSSGARRWVFLFRGPQSRPIEMGLGAARDVPLGRAREKAAAARALLADGRNPLEAKRAEAAVPTFGETSDDLIESLKGSWKNPKHRDQWISTVKIYAAPIRDLRVDHVDTEEVLKILRPIWQAKPETAARVRGRIERVLDAARARGFRKGENPARWKGHLDHILPGRSKLNRGHHAAMPYTQLPAFMSKLRARPTISNLALEFTILTAARSGESRGAVWTEINTVDAIWILPAARMKEGREHRVPLCERALEVLTLVSRLAGKRQSELVFPGLRAGTMLSDMSLTAALNRLGGNDFTVHGFRSSFRDWAGDESDFPREVAEAALSHLVGDDSERSYRRGDALQKRRALMKQWNEFCFSKLLDTLKIRTVDNLMSLARPLRERDAHKF